MDENPSIDYRLVCRTCLTSDAEFYKLDAPLISGNEKINIIDCLRYCTRLDDAPDFPFYICTKCCSDLQVAYTFIRNAIEAHDILRQKLCPIQRNNGLNVKNNNTVAKCEFKISDEKLMRFRCKICGEKVDSKKSLKDHVKLHMDIISYCCQLCTYESKKRNILSDHYSVVHGTQATREQLKPKTAQLTDSKTEEIEAGIIDPNTANAEQQFIIASQQQQQPEQQNIFLQHQNQHLPYGSNNIEGQLQHQVVQGEQINFTNHIISSANNINVNTISADAIQMEECGNEYNIANEMCIGNEFIVMADGTVEEVMGNGVVIEYINATDDGVKLADDLAFNNIVQMDTNDAAAMLNLNVEDIIIEENVPSEVNNEASVNTETNLEDEIPQAVIVVSNAKKIKCKICANNFDTQDKLKPHMLTHNEIPHFFCDQCTFYTFFKIDLTQHYKTKHNLQPTFKQLQPKNKVAEIESKETYACDLCLFETNLKSHLRRHYLSKHKVEATEIQLRPATANEGVMSNSNNNIDLKPSGVSCKKCKKVFYSRSKLTDHYKVHNLSDSYQLTTTNSSITSTHTPDSSYAKVIVQNNNNGMKIVNRTEMVPMVSTYNSIPADSIPQIVETDRTVDTNDMDFDFNGETFFEDFYGDTEINNEDNEEEDDDDEVQDLHLTSDDDNVDELLQDKQQQAQNAVGDDNKQYKAFCVHCNKNFLSQYQFENHMFIHRGLAPYRCEMCTNLYNTKRALIRHYRAVHKKIPTRDMIQAKGDKVTFDRTPVEHLILEEQKATLMCAKCPYESTELHNIQIHLNTSHGLNDENYILQKLPYECPRCIRSYATKLRLIYHLESSHSATVIQQRQSSSTTMTTARPFDTIECATTMPPSIRSDTNLDRRQSNTAATSIHQQQLQTTTIKTSPTTTTTISSSSSAAAAADSIIKEEEEEYTTNVVYYNDSDTNDTTSTTTTTTATITNNTMEVNQLKCKACQFICNKIETLNEHSKHHSSNDKRSNFNFECVICQCKYKTIESLKQHLKRHIGRKYSCPQCPKAYINRNELKCHILVHTGEMPYKCHLCCKEFRYKHHLKRHMDVAHLGKRYMCPMAGCERTFATKAQLKIHDWDHNGNIPYKCQYCKQTLKKRQLLRQHVQKVHNVILTEDDIAEIYRNNVGYTNPHDFTVTVSNGKMLRRSDVGTKILSKRSR